MDLIGRGVAGTCSDYVPKLVGANRKHVKGMVGLVPRSFGPSNLAAPSIQSPIRFNLGAVCLRPLGGPGYAQATLLWDLCRWFVGP